MAEQRYFVDERGGCIVVRDRTQTDPDYNGRDADTPGVMDLHEVNAMLCGDFTVTDLRKAVGAAIAKATGEEVRDEKT